MKKTFNILFALLLLLTGCHSAPAAEQPAAAPQPTVSVTVMEVQAYTAAPTDLPLPDLTPAPVPEEDDGAAEERIVGHCISILDALPYRADLTGDGQTETVDLVALPGETDGQPRWTVSVQKGQETKLFQTDVPEDMFSCNGHDGQQIYIVPSKDLVVVVLGYSPKPDRVVDFNALLKDIIETL